MEIYFRKLPGQRAVRSLFFDKIQVQLINELAEAGVVLYHLPEYLAAGGCCQQEVGDIKSLTALFVRCHFFKKRTDGNGPANGLED